MKVLIKQPAEVTVVPMTFGGVATISALVSVEVEPRGLLPLAASLAVNGSIFVDALTLTIEGGEAGERYLITVTADDAIGQRRQEEVEVAVLDLAWTMPDGGAPMLSIAEFVGHFGIEETVRMTDERGDGRIGRDMLVSALTAAQAVAEAEIGARYALPFADVPVVIKMAIADIARARLYPGGAPEGVAGAARFATRTLERIRTGEASIPGAASAAAGASDGPILFHSGGRAYPDGLADF